MMGNLLADALKQPESEGHLERIKKCIGKLRKMRLSPLLSDTDFGCRFGCETASQADPRGLLGVASLLLL